MKSQNHMTTCFRKYISSDCYLKSSLLPKGDNKQVQYQVQVSAQSLNPA